MKLFSHWPKLRQLIEIKGFKKSLWSSSLDQAARRNWVNLVQALTAAWSKLEDHP